jgi:hypothetical protein
MATEKTKQKSSVKKKTATTTAKTVGKAKSTAAVTKKNIVTPATEAIVKATDTVIQAKATSSKSIEPLSRLKKWNAWLAALYLLQGLVIVTLAAKVTAPVTANYQAVDTLASEANGHQVFALATRHLFDIQIAWVVAVFLIVMGVTHLLAASAFRPRFEAAVSRGVNELRWIGLGLAGGVMTVAIALLSGISQVSTLLLLFASVAAGSFLALGAEKAVANNGGKKTRFAHALCSLAAVGVLLSWLIFGGHLLGALIWDGTIPGYMYGLYACMALLLVALLLATHFRLKRQGRWADGVYTERGYMLLGFITASLLAWQIFAGVLQP